MKPGLESDSLLAEMNVIPLVDVVLVILIIFMISAPVLMKAGFQVELPKGQAGDTLKDKNLTISISAEGQLAVDGRPIDEKTLKDLVLVKMAQHGDIMVVLSADRLVQHGVVVRVMDLVKGWGIKRIGIAVDPQISQNPSP